MSILVETDSRRRLSLARLGVEKDSYYLAERREDGSIVLTPAEVRPKAMETIERLVPDLDALAQVTEVAPSPEWEPIKASLPPEAAASD